MAEPAKELRRLIRRQRPWDIDCAAPVSARATSAPAWGSGEPLISNRSWTIPGSQAAAPGLGGDPRAGPPEPGAGTPQPAGRHTSGPQEHACGVAEGRD